MEDAEEIESFYEKEIENADKEFLNGLKGTEKKINPEKAYKEKTRLIRNEYEKRYERYLQIQKSEILKERKKRPKNKKEKTEVFKVESINLGITRIEKLKLGYELLKFKFKLKRKNFFQKITPRFLLIFSLKAKMAVKRAVSSTKKAEEKAFTKIKETIISVLKDTSEKMKRVYSKIKKVISSAYRKVIKKIKLKRKGGKDEKTEDQKLAEKILAKK
ncbi:hypothetical protein A3K73_07795 [Candidatus Pacearchaeota archaeon RBG_13_36_9]|nr:MAG: hypothetical protein A3K73_07795 [Candidatus Pacearchaeota archaeon RBG_13_36_9]